MKIVEKIKRIKWGEELDAEIRGAPNKCVDCGVKVGMYHLSGCDIEVCYECSGQFLSCECDKDSITARATEHGRNYMRNLSK